MRKLFNLYLKIFILTFSYIFLDPGNVAYSAEIRASVSEKYPVVGDVIDLKIEYIDGHPIQSLDVSRLREKFSIIGSSNRSITKFINGKISSQFVWEYKISPKIPGNLTIPSFKVGSLYTNPISIFVANGQGKAPKVSKAPTPKRHPSVGVASSNINPKYKTLNLNDNITDTSSKRDIFVRASLDKSNPYVQEQVVLSLKIYDRVGMVAGSIQKPTGADILVEHNNTKKEYSEKVNGKVYKVIEQKFAVFPQKSGELFIDPIKVIAKIRNKRLGTGFFATFLTNAKTLYSKGLALNVKPVPQSYSDYWLPAKQFYISDNLENKVIISPDDPLVREITISSKGLSPVQIPALDFENNDVHYYLEDTDVAKSFDAKGSILVDKTFKYLLTPKDAGQSKIQLKEISIPWFDIYSNDLRKAEIPSKTLILSGSAEAKPDSPKASSASTKTKKESKGYTPEPQFEKSINIILISILIAIIILLILYAIYNRKLFKLLIRRKRVKKVKKTIKENKKGANINKSTLKNDIVSAFENKNYQYAANLIVTYYNTINNANIKTIGELKENFKGDVRSQLDKLNENIYKKAVNKVDYQKLIDAIENLGKNKRKGAGGNKNDVPKLYPDI
jgi:hypothetical protein